ncbi:hypothetical protein ACJA23_00260 [Mycoplasma corogypsi]|uniref:hypothetical protein n=1 Tax=Mycoplasma corogypsi TaxID=2106 RepID=UPI0038735137
MEFKKISDTLKCSEIEWLNIQKEIIDFLEKNPATKKPIKNDLILLESSKFWIGRTLEQMFANQFKDKKLVLMPIVQKVNNTIDNLEVEIDRYEIEDINVFNWNLKVDLELQPLQDFDENVNVFVKEFTKDYPFLLDKENNTVEANDVVQVLFTDKSGMEVRKQVVFVENADNVLISTLKNMKLGESKMVEHPNAQADPIKVTVEHIGYEKRMEITPDNFHLLDYSADEKAKMQTYEDAIEYVKSGARSGIVSDLIFAVGQKLITEFVKQNQNIKLPEAVVESELHRESNLNKNKELVEQYLYNFVTFRALQLKYNALPTEEDIANESVKMSQITKTELSQIDARKISEIVTLRLVGIAYLKENHPDYFENIKPYI